MKIDSIISGLRKERKHLAAQLQQLDSAITTLMHIGGHAGVRRTRTISAEGRARIASAQRKRWAKVKAQKKK